MIALALTGLEKAINAYLNLDPETVAHIAKFKDKTVAITITDWNIQFFVCLHSDGIELKETYRGKADTTISGTLFGLFNAGCAKGKNEALFKNAVDISGDTEFGEKIREIFSQIDIDWEEHLSTFVGDVAAHKIGLCVSKIFNIGHYSRTTLRTNLQEYLQHEIQQVPTALQVEKYIHDVGILQNDVDRVEARINHLIAERKVDT